LLGGDLGLKQGLRVDEVADGFGLGQVEASVEKGAHGEFSGLGETGAAGEREFDDVAEDYRRAVGGDFYDVVGGVGVGLGEVGDYDFVDAGLSFGVGRRGAPLRGTDECVRPYVSYGGIGSFAGGGARATRFD